ncbi:MAG: MerC domain-containing protein [Tunicatimonas sp.]
MRISSWRKNSDLIGIGSSVLCIIHCLLLPVLILAGSLTGDTHRWAWLDYLFILLATLAVFYSTRRLKSTFLRRGLWLTLVVFSGSIVFHEHHPAALYISVASSLLLVVLHLGSYREKHS